MSSGSVGPRLLRGVFFFLGLLPGLLFLFGILYWSWTLFREEIARGTSPVLLAPAVLLALIFAALISGRLKSKGPPLPQDPPPPPPPEPPRFDLMPPTEKWHDGGR